mmetsp:Transcript_21049/g.67823  ORF Transcript_21049/g.67823 Transcript_21049/m.67823 type:complete len:131 (+) Transcript_21049:123-515(+)
MQVTLFLALLAPAAAFMHAPASSATMRSTALFGAGKYDGQVWDMDAKVDMWNMWDPNTARSETNFNPFERDATGNACDTSGYFPGETKYKDPMRPDMNFAKMMEEKETMAKIEASPKPGDVPGAPGCLPK